MPRKLFVPLGIAFAFAPAAGFAQSVNFFFTSTTGSTPTTNVTLTLGQTTFDLSIWYQVSGGTFPHFDSEILVGYDRSNSEGTAATAMDNVIGLNGSIDTAVSNYNTATYPIDFAVVSGGWTQNGAADNSIRPFGADVVVSGTSLYDPGNAAVHLFDISFANLKLQPGQSYNIVLWDAGAGPESTTYLDDGTTYLRPGQSTTLTVTMSSVPEPASIVALGLGAVALIRRRRR